ncbi:MAG TPA: DUF3943 domain-containing protein [Gemmatimonadales bacterium]|nr:DUF3943 domain-containing protein [Gemmatimonadales bacterium]
MRAPLLAGIALACLGLAGPAQAQGPFIHALFPVADDTTSAVDLRAPLDTAWLGATLLTPIPEPSALALASAGSDTTRPSAFRGDTTLPCLEFECAEPGTRKKRFWRALGEVVVVNIIPNAFSRLQDKEWSQWTLQSWADNIKYPWQWDNNAFLNNQFSHPYHGSLYFNSARTNGYNFWESVPWAFGGSLMWELFFEVWAPAPNDLLNTSLGGIALGEMLYRMSSLTLDNEASGTERVFREIGATLLNPVRGFNRALDGTMFKRSRTPDEWRPSTIQANLELGYRRFATDWDVTDPNALNTGYLGAGVVYGNGVTDVTKAPFSHFRLNLLLAFNPGENARKLSELNVRGSLGGKSLARREGKASQLVGFMTYEYSSSPVIEFGAQGFQGGWSQASRGKKGPTWYLDATAIFNPIAAIKSDYFLVAEGRDYDYGIGLGGRGEVRAIWGGKALVGVTANYRFIPVISGFPAQHQLLRANFDARYYFKHRLGVGLTYEGLRRWSAYTDRSDFNRKSGELRLFVTTALPRWEEFK